MKKTTILLVDDDKNLLEIYRNLFELKGFNVIACNNSYEALSLIKNKKVAVVIADIIMPKMNGMELLVAIKKIAPMTEVIMLTAEGSISGAVEAVKQGAFSYFVKPANIEELLLSINKAAELANIKDENDTLKECIVSMSNNQEFIGISDIAQNLREKAKRIGDADSPVLIMGETGTGKEVLANMIHKHSRRATSPFICVNCGALNENLIESALFGSEKGAYTGAESLKKGYFEVADGGTIFFDEIGELSASMQVRLLRVLQEKSFQRVGSTETIRSDFRLITATNRDLKKEVEENRFRADLYYRINVLPITIPPLRERREDIDVLCQHFVNYYSKEINKKVNHFTDEFIEGLKKYDWPGNVRELRNIIERLIVLSVNGEVNCIDLPEEIRTKAMDTNEICNEYGLKSMIKETEKEYIETIIKECNGNITKAAEKLGIARKNLYKKLSEYNINYK